MTYGKFCDMLPVFTKRVCVSYFLYITKHVLTFRHKICFFWYIWKNVHLPFFFFFEIAVFIITIFIIIHFFLLIQFSCCGVTDCSVAEHLENHVTAVGEETVKKLKQIYVVKCDNIVPLVRLIR